MGKYYPLRAPAAKVALEIILSASLKIDYSYSDMNIGLTEDIEEMERAGNLHSHYGTEMIGFWLKQLVGAASMEAEMKRLMQEDHNLC